MTTNAPQYTSVDQQPTQHYTPLIRAGIVLGIGFGGFFDGIVFHQILQWHHVISSEVAPDTVPALELNTLADGLFHGATYIVTLIGLYMLFRASRRLEGARSNRILSGAMLVGFGLFNLVEGIINHHILGLHHVRAGENQTLYDLAFLLAGALLVAVGAGLIRSYRRTGVQSS